MKLLARTAVLFVAIGVVLYAGLFVAADALVRRNGWSNPVFKLLAADRTDYDWLILGASHAMPFAFDGMEAEIEARTGRTILNLAGPGTGPLYARFVHDLFGMAGRRAAAVLYVADAFAFAAPAWNEDRIADTGLLARTPFDFRVARRLGQAVREEGVDPRALADYLTGFSKINDHDRFARDVWEGEAQFDRTVRPSATAERKRIEYLHPPAKPRDRDRYLAVLADLVRAARQAGSRVVVLRPPLPDRFRRQLPDESGFDVALAAALVGTGAELVDLSGAIDDPKLWFDTDHLNRAGVRRLVAEHLGPLLSGTPEPD